jgi:hypothetical protein
MRSAALSLQEQRSVGHIALRVDAISQIAEDERAVEHSAVARLEDRREPRRFRAGGRIRDED